MGAAQMCDLGVSRKNNEHQQPHNLIVPSHLAARIRLLNLGEYPFDCGRPHLHRSHNGHRHEETPHEKWKEAHESHVQEQRNAETDRILQECFNQDLEDQSRPSVSTTLVQTNGCLTSAVAPHTSGPSSNTLALLSAPSGMQHKRAADPETEPRAHQGGEMADTQALPPPAKAVRTTSSTAQLHTFAGASPAQGGSADGVS